MSPPDRGQDGRGAEEQVHLPQQDVHSVPGLRPRGGGARGQSGIRGTACPSYIQNISMLELCQVDQFYLRKGFLCEQSQFGEVL